MPAMMRHAIINTAHVAIIQDVYSKILPALCSADPAMLMTDIISNTAFLHQNVPSAFTLIPMVKTFSVPSRMIAFTLP